MRSDSEQESPEAASEPRLPPFAMLRAFDAMVRLGGVRKAARALGLHHSVVSRQAAQLEVWLGTPLLARVGKAIRPTSRGAAYHTQISAALAQIADATRDLLDREAERPLRIWCSQGLSTEWMALHITEFERLHPGMRIELRPSAEPANLRRHEADVNIFMHVGPELDETEAGLRDQILARPQSMIAVSPTLVAQLSWIKSAGDLIKAPLLHGAHTHDWRVWLSAQGVDVPSVLPGELCWQPHMALEAARLGRGVALGNRFFFERDLDRGSLVELKVAGTTNRAFGCYKFVAREDRWSAPRISDIRRFLCTRMKALEAIPG